MIYNQKAIYKNVGPRIPGKQVNVLQFDKTVATELAVGNWYPVMSIRIDPTVNDIYLQTDQITVMTTDSAVFAWSLMWNDPADSIIGGGADSASWVSIDGSSIQYDFTRQTVNTVTYRIEQSIAGTPLSNEPEWIQYDILNNHFVGRNMLGDPLEYVLCVYPGTNAPATQRFLGAMLATEFPVS